MNRPKVLHGLDHVLTDHVPVLIGQPRLGERRHIHQINEHGVCGCVCTLPVGDTGYVSGFRDILAGDGKAPVGALSLLAELDYTILDDHSLDRLYTEIGLCIAAASGSNSL